MSETAPGLLTAIGGGPAFPRTGGEVPGPNATEWVAPQTGMSLRDYFAAKALVAILNMDGIQYLNRYSDHAKAAYEQADAMLAARTPPTS